MREQSASVGCVKGCECPDRQRAPSVGFTGREADVGWSLSLHVQSPLAGSKGFTAVHENKKPWAGERVGGGSQRKEAAFLSFICKADQTELAAVPPCCVMSQAGLQAMQADSSLLGWEQSSLGVLLCWEAKRPSDPTLQLVHLPHYSPTSHLQENQDSTIRPINGRTGYETTFWMTFGEGKTIICVGENLIWKGKGKTLSVWKGK